MVNNLIDAVFNDCTKLCSVLPEINLFKLLAILANEVISISPTLFSKENSVVTPYIIYVGSGLALIFKTALEILLYIGTL